MTGRKEPIIYLLLVTFSLLYRTFSTVVDDDDYLLSAPQRAVILTVSPRHFVVVVVVVDDDDEAVRHTAPFQGWAALLFFFLISRIISAAILQ